MHSENDWWCEQTLKPLFPMAAKKSLMTKIYFITHSLDWIFPNLQGKPENLMKTHKIKKSFDYLSPVWSSKTAEISQRNTLKKDCLILFLFFFIKYFDINNCKNMFYSCNKNYKLYKTDNHTWYQPDVKDLDRKKSACGMMLPDSAPICPISALARRWKRHKFNTFSHGKILYTFTSFVLVASL